MMSHQYVEVDRNKIELDTARIQLPDQSNSVALLVGSGLCDFLFDQNTIPS